jgi:uncharacterized membrane protein YqgA involved in biofilm formation
LSSQNNKNLQDQNQGKQLNSYARFSGIAIQMLAIIIAGTYIGVKLDEKFPNEHDLYTLAFSLSSVIIAIIYVIRRIIAASKKDN